MKRIALVAAMALLCMCMVGCASNSAPSSQSGSAAPSVSSSSAGASSTSDTVGVGEEVDVAGSIIMVTSDSFVVDCSGIHFTCIPADPSTLSYVTAGNFVKVEGTIASIEGEGSITIDSVTVDDYSDGYKNIGEHYEHHNERHHHG